MRSAQQHQVGFASRQLLARGGQAQPRRGFPAGDGLDQHRGRAASQRVLADRRGQQVGRRRGRTDLAPEDGVEPQNDAHPQPGDALPQHVQRFVEGRLGQEKDAVGAHQQRIEGGNAADGHRLVVGVEERRLVEARHPAAQQERRVPRGQPHRGARSHGHHHRQRVHAFTSRTTTCA